MKTDRRSFMRALGFATAVVPMEAETGELVPQEVKIESPVDHHLIYEVAEEMLYSGISIAPYEMLDSYQLFVEPLGMPRLDGEYTTRVTTNMLQTGRLPMPCGFGVTSYGIVFAPVAPKEVYLRFAERYAFSFWIANKQYFQAPLAAMFEVSDHPLSASAKGFVDLDLPTVIPPGMTFTARLDGTPFRTGTKLKLWGAVKGRHLRSVQ